MNKSYTMFQGQIVYHTKRVIRLNVHSRYQDNGDDYRINNELLLCIWLLKKEPHNKVAPYNKGDEE